MPMTHVQPATQVSMVQDAPLRAGDDAHEQRLEQLEQEVKSAARKVIARLSRASLLEDLPVDDAVHYQSMLAQLALAQLALTYPRALLGICAVEGAHVRFVAEEDGLYVRCVAPEGHGWKIG